jgi:hypothetical protein
MPISNELREALSKRRRPASNGSDVVGEEAIERFRRDDEVDALVGRRSVHDANFDDPGRSLVADGPDTGKSRNAEREGNNSIAPAGDDPDDCIDPDDSLSKLEVITLPPPAQSEAWWIALVLGRESDAVAPQDASLALAHVAYRLEYARADRGNPITESTTVGLLYEAIEEMFGPAAWTALVECWHTAAGIVQPERKSIRSDTDILNRIPDRTNPAAISAQSTIFKSTAFDTEQPPLPPTPYDLDPGLAHAIGTAPWKVAAFLLHVPRDPPAWRYQETEAERAHRELLEGEGSWTG